MPPENLTDSPAVDDARTDDAPVVDPSAEDESRADAERNDYVDEDDGPDFDTQEDAERLQRDYDEGRISDRDALAGLLNLASGNPVAQYQAERDNENDA